VEAATSGPETQLKLGRRRPGTATVFVDAVTNEALLQVAVDDGGTPVLAFRLYDATGALVRATEGFETFPDGLTVTALDGEMILTVPASGEDNLSYRLYNQEGRLLTVSDGSRTQIFAFLKMEARANPLHNPGQLASGT
jgi:hypothetical protein